MATVRVTWQETRQHHALIDLDEVDARMPETFSPDWKTVEAHDEMLTDKIVKLPASAVNDDGFLGMNLTKIEVVEGDEDVPMIPAPREEPMWE